MQPTFEISDVWFLNKQVVGAAFRPHLGSLNRFMTSPEWLLRELSHHLDMRSYHSLRRALMYCQHSQECCWFCLSHTYGLCSMKFLTERFGPDMLPDTHTCHNNTLLRQRRHRYNWKVNDIGYFLGIMRQEKKIHIWRSSEVAEFNKNYSVTMPLKHAYEKTCYNCGQDVDHLDFSEDSYFRCDWCSHFDRPEITWDSDLRDYAIGHEFDTKVHLDVLASRNINQLETSVKEPYLETVHNSFDFSVEITSYSSRLADTKVDDKLLKPTSRLNPKDLLYSYTASIKVVKQWEKEGHARTRTLKMDVRDKTFEELTRTRHDFVANLCLYETDVSFREIGIDSIQTPDFIHKTKHEVFELATNASGAAKSMESSYLSKRSQYEQICEMHGLNLLILVVSPGSIMSNMALSPFEKSDLVGRCRIGINLENSLEQVFDVLLTYNDEDQKSLTELKEKFLEFNKTSKKTSDMQMSEELDALNRTLNEEEEAHVSRILKETLLKAVKGDVHRPNKTALDEYLDHFTGSNSQDHQSQISIFPFILAKPREFGKRGSFPEVGMNIDCPQHLLKILRCISGREELINEQTKAVLWKQEARVRAARTSTDFPVKGYVTKEKEETRTSKHQLRKSFVVYPCLDSTDELALALKGVGAKNKTDLEELKEKTERKHKSFHPDTPVDDIAEFHSDLDFTLDDENWEREVESQQIWDFIKEEKKANPLRMSDVDGSVELVSYARGTKICQMGYLISDICQEIAMEYKVPTKEGSWLIKPLRKYKCILFLKVTGSHTFFFLAFEKASSKKWEKGRLGPRIFETDNYYISDICSIMEYNLEHYMKAGPYLTMILCHLLHSFRVPITMPPTPPGEDLIKTFNFIFLTFLNNKIDHEEMITNLRFLYMKLFQMLGANPYDYVDRLPDALRSRLSVYTLKRIMVLLKHYERTRIKSRHYKVNGETQWDYRGIRTIFHDNTVKFDELIDSFYYSYVVTKAKSAMPDHTYQIYAKVFKEQMRGLREVTNKGLKPWGLLKRSTVQRWDYALERRFLEMSVIFLRREHGPNVIELMRKEIYNNLRKIKLSDLSTLKASAKDYLEEPEVTFESTNFNRREFMEAFKKLNPIKGKGRPRVVTKLVLTVEQYKKVTGTEEVNPISLMLWATKMLEDRGFVVCDLFIKDQHNGVREIHVMEILGRLAQYLAENIARTICRFFNFETTSNPDFKKKFYLDHERKANAEIGNHVTVCRSADATKWCQRNHVSQFYFEMSFFCPPEMRPFLYSLFSTWTRKRIYVSAEMRHIFEASLREYTDNKDLIDFRECYFKGKQPFLEKCGSFIQTEFGMWQGLFQNASSLKQSIRLAGWSILATTYMEKVLNLDVSITTIGASDDSGALLSVNDTRPVVYCFAVAMHWWAEQLGEYLSIWSSYAKSSIGTLNMVEYNSEWWYNGRNIRPSFRWNSACLETTLVERLPQRVEMFYNGITQSLESGSSTLLCACIQLCQALHHYQLMGIGSSLLSDEVISHWKRTKSVSLGYFPLELDEVCGVTGLDFSLYCLSKRGVRIGNFEQMKEEYSKSIDYEGKLGDYLRNSLRSHSIKFSDITKYKRVLRETNLPDLDTFIQDIEDHPELLFLDLKTWKQTQLKLVMMLRSPGVVASLSAYQPTARMVSASSYLFDSPCVRGSTQTGAWEKRSLLGWLALESTAEEKFVTKRSVESPEDKDWFPNQEQFEEWAEQLMSLKNSYGFQDVVMRRSNRLEIQVWGYGTDIDYPILDVVRRAWFNVRSIKCGETAFSRIWKEYKSRYPFLKDTLKDTLSLLKVDTLTLFRMLNTIHTKSRKIRLTDSSAKRTDLWNTLTRVYWPNTKLRTIMRVEDSTVRTLKHGLHCILSYFYKKSHTISLCAELLKNNEQLKKVMKPYPRYISRVKLFHDFLQNKDLMKWLIDVEDCNHATIGYFSKDQKMVYGDYKGRGEWKGSVSGVSTRIVMFDDEVESVTVRTVPDFTVFPRALVDLIKTFNLKFPKRGQGLHSKLYLNSSGRIKIGSEDDVDCCPFFTNPSMKLNIMDHLLEQEYYLDVENEKLQICFKLRANRTAQRKFVILSENFHSGHWDPLLPSPNLSDENFELWCRGIPCKPVTLLNQCLVPNNRYDLDNTRRLLEAKRYMRPETPYDLNKLLSRFRQFYAIKGLGKTALTAKHEYTTSKVVEKAKGPTLDRRALDQMDDQDLGFITELSAEGRYRGKFSSKAFLTEINKVRDAMANVESEYTSYLKEIKRQDDENEKEIDKLRKRDSNVAPGDIYGLSDESDLEEDDEDDEEGLESGMQTPDSIKELNRPTGLVSVVEGAIDSYDELKSDTSSRLGFGEEDFRPQFEDLDEWEEAFLMPDSALEKLRTQESDDFRSNWSQAGNFFKSFLTLIDDMPNSLSVKRKLSEERSLDGLDLFGMPGALLYLCFNSGSYMGDYFSYTQKVSEIAAMSDHLSSSSAKGVGLLDLQKMEDELKQIEQVIDHLPPLVRENISKRKERLMAEIKFYHLRANSESRESELHKYDKKSLITQVYRHLVDKGFWDPRIAFYDESMLIEHLVASAIEGTDRFVDFGMMSKQEAELARVDAYSPRPSEELLKAISLTTNTNILIYDGVNKVYEHSRSTLSNYLIINLKTPLGVV